MRHFIICLILFITCLSACQTATEKPKQLEEAPSAKKVEQKEPTPPLKAAKIDANRWKADEHRNKNWLPKEGKYFFSEQWVWQFENEFLKEGDPERTGDVAFYVDPPSGMILLTRAESKYTDEMTDWVMIHPDGLYLTGMTDEHGKKTMTSKKMTEFEDYKMIIQQQKAAFDIYFKKGTGTKVFGKDDYNNPTIEGEAYIMDSTTKLGDLSVYLGTLPFSMKPFYLVEKTNDELGFPINMQYGYLLADNEIVLSEEMRKGEKAARSYLKSMSAASHFLDINAYELVK